VNKSAFVVVLALSGFLTGCAATGPSGSALINASDKTAIYAAMPTVTVVGVVDNVNSSEEVVIINFKDTQDSQFYAVVLRASRDALEKSFNGDIGKAITGKTIQVTGTIVLYHDRPEIVVSKPEQLVVTN